jgi:hypothetical protein
MAMKKFLLILAILALTAAPGLAHAGALHPGSHENRSRAQAQFFWRPFFYAGPFVYGYPAGLGYAYPGPYFDNGGGDATRYAYGFPGPYTYGVYSYPAGLGYAYRGQHLANSDGEATRYTYGYPGPYTYGVYGYRRPSCAAQLNGYWVCS